MQTVAIQTRVPKEMKMKAEKILKRLGLDFSSLQRLLLAQIVEQQKVPFEISLSHTEKWDDLSAEEENQLWLKAGEKSMAELWNSPEDDVWDKILPTLPPIDTV